MSRHPSNTPLTFDSSSVEFLRHAVDLGEVIAILTGGARPDPERQADLCASLRAVQSYLIDGGRERARFEAADDAPVAPIKVQPPITVNVALPASLSLDERRRIFRR